ncbi:type II restriction endonuclease [Helicobacter pylori Hp H-6]|uniref:Type II restriction endonuclease n=1 Tax=Helicobacter pylori Hp H-6 TaxID=992061 RepID=J0NA99_HELPX|nr:type II restriction endonuclease [Helicobacter pylori Hp H-6]
MHISEVKTAFKIADVEYVKDSTKLNFNYLKNLKDENNQPLSQNILTQNVARVYLIVVDGEIKKIGGSQADGGIKSTLNIFIKMGESKGGLVLEVLACGIFFTIRYLRGLK